jgi:hypothetical protein
LETLGTYWRYVGSIQLIAGTDLATATLQPHEFLDFVRGRLSRQFIQGRVELDQHLAEMDARPDWDGRFRVNEFFCHDDTWRMALSQLVAASDVVLMDLRGFSRQNQGCVFELTELVNVVPLSQVVLIIDGTTDLPFLEETLHQTWETMSATSPNQIGAVAELKMFRLTGDTASAVKRLLLTLLNAANASRTENGGKAWQFAHDVAHGESWEGTPNLHSSYFSLAKWRKVARGAGLGLVVALLIVGAILSDRKAREASQAPPLPQESTAAVNNELTFLGSNELPFSPDGESASPTAAATVGSPEGAAEPEIKVQAFSTEESQRVATATRVPVQRPRPEYATRAPEKPLAEVLQGTYQVLVPTLLRSKPRADAPVVTQLESGIRVWVVGASGDYLEVRSRKGRAPGYVLREHVVLVSND